MAKYLNTDIQYHQNFESISEEEGIIKGITVIKEGEANGHNLFINSKFLDDVVVLGNQRSAGVKARFGHPNICATALGTYLGRYKNFRRQGDKVLADLHLDSSSKTSPKGNLYEYTIRLAATNPDMFGASISFKRGVSTFETFSKDGKEEKREYATITDLYATDLVDDPAATDGLFEAFEHDDLASQVTQFLDANPQIFTLLDKHPDLFTDFLTRYKNYKSLPCPSGRGLEQPLKSISMNLKEEFSNLKSWLKDKFLANPSELPSSLEGGLENSLEQGSENLLNKTESLSSSSEEGLENPLVIELKAKILQLENKISQMEASATSLDFQGDPALNISKPADTAGKELLNAIPDDQKRQFKIQSKLVSQSKSE